MPDPQGALVGAHRACICRAGLRELPAGWRRRLDREAPCAPGRCCAWPESASRYRPSSVRLSHGGQIGPGGSHRSLSGRQRAPRSRWDARPDATRTRHPSPPCRTRASSGTAGVEWSFWSEQQVTQPPWETACSQQVKPLGYQVALLTTNGCPFLVDASEWRPWDRGGAVPHVRTGSPRSGRP